MVREDQKSAERDELVKTHGYSVFNAPEWLRMSKIRIMLTGGGGVVGRNLLENPAIDAFEVLAPKSRELDLCDFNEVQAYLRKHRPEMVIHAAGQVGDIQANMREPVGFLLKNLGIGQNIVWVAHQVGIKRRINLGRSWMYPRIILHP